MDKLWAPWRVNYIMGKKEKGCVLCRLLKQTGGKSLVVKRSALSFALLNAYPYNNGHIMIIPNRHTSDVGRLSRAEVLDMHRLTGEMITLLKKTLRPKGFNLGMNLGRAAGAGIADHLHLHIVPRWNGDTNFMPVTGSTKIISQSLDELSKLLRAGIK